MNKRCKGILVELLLLPFELVLAVLGFVLSFATIGLVGILGGDEEWMLAPFILTWYFLSFGYYIVIDNRVGKLS